MIYIHPRLYSQGFLIEFNKKWAIFIHSYILNDFLLHLIRNELYSPVWARLACQNSYTCQAAGLHPISLHNDKQDNNVRTLHRPLCETLQQCVKLHQHTMTSIAIVAGMYHNSRALNQGWRHIYIYIYIYNMLCI